MIMVVVMSFTELILLGYLHLINYDLSHIDMLSYPMYLYCIQGILYFILFTLSLKLFSKRYLIFLKEKVIKHMKILTITLYIINSRVLSLKNKIKKVKPPNKLPSIIFLILIISTTPVFLGSAYY